jgi:hypothetical protein
VNNLDHSLDRATTWLAEVAPEFGTEDRRFAYRVTRAWMHVLRIACRCRSLRTWRHSRRMCAAAAMADLGSGPATGAALS